MTNKIPDNRLNPFPSSTKITKLSTQNADFTWSFVDPLAFEWVFVAKQLRYLIADRKIGLVADNETNPRNYKVVAQHGDRVYNDTASETFTLSTGEQGILQ